MDVFRKLASDEELLKRVACWPSYPLWTDLTEQVLCEISAKEGIDFATALLYQRIVSSREHGQFIQQVESLTWRRTAPLRPSTVTVAIVPAAFYVENPHTGADGRRVREQVGRLGCAAETIPIASTGSLMENARTICAWLSARAEGPIILVSLSKGGADVKMALTEADASFAFRNVIGWISLCGILNGTPASDWLLSWKLGAVLNRLYQGLQGRSLRFVEDLHRGPGGTLASELPLPAHITLVSIVGFPLRHHLRNGVAHRFHRRLAPLGPNDGGLILADVCRLPGLIYPVWGADHYLHPGRDVSDVVGRVLQSLDWEARGPHLTNTAELEQTG
jgi:hypothetical protein